jgi:hypothetical protein
MDKTSFTIFRNDVRINVVGWLFFFKRTYGFDFDLEK